MLPISSIELSIDLETRSDVNLTKTSVYKYAASDRFKILLVSYRFSDEGQIKTFEMDDYEKNESVREEHKRFFNALTDPSILKVAYNAGFERICLSHWLGLYPFLPVEQWDDTAVWVREAGLPASLDKAGRALFGEDKDKTKMKEGKDLIRYFCIPYRGKFHEKEDAPERWETFKKYNAQDVQTEWNIRQIVKQIVRNPERKLWLVDQHISDRGVRIDATLAEQATKWLTDHKEKLLNESSQITGLENPNSRTQLIPWLKAQGLDLANADGKETIDKAKIAELLTREDLPDDVRRVLRIRQITGATSTSKYEKMLETKNDDDRVRGTLRFYGANTGRWAGAALQPQNLPKNHMPIPDLRQCRNAAKHGMTDLLPELVAKDYKKVDDPDDLLSELVRTALIPSDGCHFVVSDFSAIEARVVAWLSGEEWRLDVFRNGGDIYCESASKIFGVPVKKHGVNSNLRPQGKVAELACIAEGSLVQTDKGLKPIELVSTDDRVWDGENYVSHEGVIDKGKRFVITYDNLSATFDHKVYVQERSKPIMFGFAAMNGYHLVHGTDTECEKTYPLTGKEVTVYDIKNAGPNHRYCVQNRIVHNCGYGGGVGAMRAMDFNHVIDNDAKYQKIVDDWRKASPHVCRAWKDFEVMVLGNIRATTPTPKLTKKYHGIYADHIKVPGSDASLLRIMLPSGRDICYLNPTYLRSGQSGNFEFTYDSGTAEQTKAWGGKIFENITQAIARDILAEKIQILEACGYHIVFHVHDEMIIDTDDPDCAKFVDKVMAAPVDWAPGLPLKGDTYECEWYRKE